MGNEPDAPSPFLFLSETVSWLLAAEPDPSADWRVRCEIYAWAGGKAHYRASPEAAAALRDLVDREALAARKGENAREAARLATERAAVREAAREASLAEEDRTEKPRVPFVPSGNLLRDLRRLGAESVGTPDLGHAMQLVLGGRAVQVCRGDAPSLARSSRFVLREMAVEGWRNIEGDWTAERVVSLLSEPPHLTEDPPSGLNP
jgi:hypothetical protein